MSHGHRFYRPEGLNEEIVGLDGDEARHAARVLRLKEGDRVTLMDGVGGTRDYKVRELTRSGISIEASSDAVISEVPIVRPFLLLGAPDHKALEELLLHAVELGLWRLALVEAKRSPAPIEQFMRRRDRLCKIAVAGIKQSGNPFAPEISFHDDLVDALTPAPARGFIADPEGQALRRLDGGFEGDIAACVGPEGDFTPEEKELIGEKGYLKVSLAPFTLRVETAVLAVLSAFTSQGS